MYTLLVGEIGIPRREFLYDLRLWEIRAIVRGYRRRAALTWEPARWQSYIWLRARGAKEYHRPQDVLKFPWELERGETSEPISDEEVERIREQIREENARLQKKSAES